jgi:hypothetical protein
MAGTIKVVTSDQLPLVAASAPRVAPTPQPTAFVPVDQALPRESFAAIQRLLVDGPGLPAKEGYAIGLHDQADELLRDSKLLSAAQSNSDAAGVRRHAEHIFNLIAGSRDPASATSTATATPKTLATVSGCCQTAIRRATSTPWQMLLGARKPLPTVPRIFVYTRSTSRSARSTWRVWPQMPADWRST